jgi:hypothetical protein
LFCYGRSLLYRQYPSHIEPPPASFARCPPPRKAGPFRYALTVPTWLRN